MLLVAAAGDEAIGVGRDGRGRPVLDRVGDREHVVPVHLDLAAEADVLRTVPDEHERRLGRQHLALHDAPGRVGARHLEAARGRCDPAHIRVIGVGRSLRRQQRDVGARGIHRLAVAQELEVVDPRPVEADRTVDRARVDLHPIRLAQRLLAGRQGLEAVGQGRRGSPCAGLRRVRRRRVRQRAVGPRAILHRLFGLAGAILLHHRIDDEALPEQQHAHAQANGDRPVLPIHIHG